MPAIIPPSVEGSGTVVLNTHYSSQVFKHKSVLSSQQLKDFQSGYQKALRGIAKSFSKYGDWGIINSVTTHIDAIFTEDASGVDYYSHGDSARHASKTPVFPIYFTYAIGDNIYFGHRLPFASLTFVFDTFAGATIFNGADDPYLKYWDGSVWAYPTGRGDTTGGFTGNGAITWTEPTDWGMNSLDNILGLNRYSIDTENRFWVRIEIEAIHATKALIDTVQRTAYGYELYVRAKSTPDTYAQICPGIGMINGRAVRVEDIEEIDLASYLGFGANSRYIIIQLSQDGIISAKASDVAVSPIEPEADYNNIKLCNILVTSADATIVNGDIDNCRIFIYF